MEKRFTDVYIQNLESNGSGMKNCAKKTSIKQLLGELVKKYPDKYIHIAQDYRGNYGCIGKKEKNVTYSLYIADTILEQDMTYKKLISQIEKLFSK